MAMLMVPVNDSTMISPNSTSEERSIGSRTVRRLSAPATVPPETSLMVSLAHVGRK